jgi:hypothetical protein
MRKFAWTLVALCALTLGCNKPVETIPTVTPEPEASSGTTLDEGDHAGHEHAEEPAAEEPPAEQPPAEGTETAEEGKAEQPATTDEPSAANDKMESIRFVADKRVNVPGMMCPYSCWPKVKETLAALPGVEGVQLAEQPEGTAEGEIKERVVELKLNENFDADAAVAALAKVSFEAEIAN